MMSSRADEHAIVIGGSMAGLLAARVLADYFAKVTVVERDVFPVGSENRRGVPQGLHTHGLLASGREILESLFPGISDRLEADGAVRADIVQDAVWYLEGGCHTRPASHLEGLMASRPFLERAVREQVQRMPNVVFRVKCTVTGLTTSPDRTRVTGVSIGGETLVAGLVVDASGRGSHSAQWLQAMGCEKPEEERVEIGLGYTTRFFRRHAASDVRDLAVIIPPTPGGKRGGAMLAQEGGRWTVTLISRFGPCAPTELDGFMAYAQALPAPYIYQTIRQAESIGDAVTTRFPASVRRRYERLKRPPEGYVVMGDALSSFNPVYGQGMSVAALEAMELSRTLAGNRDHLPRRFYEKAAKVVDTPWSIAVGNDLRMAEAKGPRSFASRLTNAYISKLHQTAHRDPRVTLAFHEVGNLLAPPQSLLHPRILCRVLWNGVWARRKWRTLTGPTDGMKEKLEAR